MARLMKQSSLPVLAGLGWMEVMAATVVAAPMPILPLHVIDVLGTETSGQVISSTTPSESGLTVPSLWWTTQQFGQGVIERWFAYPAKATVGGRVELYVLNQAWGRLQYLNRFALAQHFGTAASDFGYNLLIVDRRRTILGAYTCDFQAVPTPFVPDLKDFRGHPVPDFVSGANPADLNCQVWINPAIPVSVF